MIRKNMTREEKIKVRLAKIASGEGLVRKTYESDFYAWKSKIKNENINASYNITFSESRKDFGDSFYITVFDLDFYRIAKIRFSGHSVSNPHRVFNEIHNPAIDDFYKIFN